MPEITIKFARTVRPAEYESMTAEVFVTEMVDDTVDIEQFAKNQYLILKGLVYEQLGLPVSIDETGVMVEQAKAPAPAAFPQAAAPAPMPAPAPAPTATDAAVAAVTQAMPGAQVMTGPGACGKCGGTDFYDNRAENQVRRTMINPIDGQPGASLSPDFKCKACKAPKWPSDFDQYRNRPKVPAEAVRALARQQ